VTAAAWKWATALGLALLADRAVLAQRLAPTAPGVAPGAAKVPHAELAPLPGQANDLFAFGELSPAMNLFVHRLQGKCDPNFDSLELSLFLGRAAEPLPWENGDGFGAFGMVFQQRLAYDHGFQRHYLDDDFACSALDLTPNELRRCEPPHGAAIDDQGSSDSALIAWLELELFAPGLRQCVRGLPQALDDYVTTMARAGGARPNTDDDAWTNGLDRWFGDNQAPFRNDGLHVRLREPLPLGPAGKVPDGLQITPWAPKSEQPLFGDPTSLFMSDVPLGLGSTFDFSYPDGTAPNPRIRLNHMMFQLLLLKVDINF
jgi:hypothetical protein